MHLRRAAFDRTPATRKYIREQPSKIANRGGSVDITLFSLAALCRGYDLRRTGSPDGGQNL